MNLIPGTRLTVDSQVDTSIVSVSLPRSTSIAISQAVIEEIMIAFSAWARLMMLAAIRLSLSAPSTHQMRTCVSRTIISRSPSHHPQSDQWPDHTGRRTAGAYRVARVRSLRTDELPGRDVHDPLKSGFLPRAPPPGKILELGL